MAQERSGAARVIAQEGERVQVEHPSGRMTVPLRGFPPGFKLRPGGRVILVDEAEGTVARPLVRALRAKLPRETIVQRGAIDAEGGRLEMQPGTLVEERGHPPDIGSAEYELWVVDRGEGEAAQVVAARRSQ